ncbi:hypothetical protein [Nocardioides sp. TF02-7]|uniref:hypothetical protein n=1 Tax=Nocardioides sp. TF02-7 TaxID=2917724 RepID=UPI001F063CAC|nr:hypothetical protein [Nocardioides sp. TF02-7]UMG93354.1 hypothetical protein MF408_03515 [Nocardioides sp. TF02-7]
MGNHRADRRAGSRRRSEQAERYVGRRVAGRSEPSTPPAKVPVAAAAAQPALPAAPVLATETVTHPAVVLAASDATTTGSLKPAVPGKRRAVKPAARTALFRGLPTMPVVAGVATLAVSAGGVLTSTQQPALVGADSSRIAAPNAATGTSGTGIHSEVERSPS